jgi:hypothetical protein
MTLSPSSLKDLEEVRAANLPLATKMTIIGFASDGEPVWGRRPSPAQDAAYIAKCHRERDAALSCAKRLSKLAVGYARGASDDTNPDRAANWITEARRLRDRAWSHFRMARRNNI